MLQCKYRTGWLYSYRTDWLYSSSRAIVLLSRGSVRSNSASARLVALIISFATVDLPMCFSNPQVAGDVASRRSKRRPCRTRNYNLDRDRPGLAAARRAGTAPVPAAKSACLRPLRPPGSMAIEYRSSFILVRKGACEHRQKLPLCPRHGNDEECMLCVLPAMCHKWFMFG